MFFFDDSAKTLRELLEVLSKGIDLLANDNLNAELYYAYVGFRQKAYCR